MAGCWLYNECCSLPHCTVMGVGLIRFCLLIAVLLAAKGAVAQRIEFVRLNRELIEQRLREVPKKDPLRKDKISALFEQAGCKAGLSEQPVKGQRLPNVICTLQGSGDSVILVGAHFDHAAAGDGIADNWSGVVLLPALYESLAQHPRKHSFVFIAFTAEEQGLLGSRYYAKHMAAEEVARTRAMVNLDTMGLSSTKVWASRADKNLLDALRRVANAIDLPLAGVNVERVGSTDAESFAPLKIPRIAIHSVTQGTFPILHSPFDNLRALKLDEYYDSYRLVATYLAYLDGVLD